MINKTSDTKCQLAIFKYCYCSTSFVQYFEIFLGIVSLASGPLAPRMYIILVKPVRLGTTGTHIFTLSLVLFSLTSLSFLFFSISLASTVFL